MSRLVENLADKGDAAIARFSEKHFPQSDEAIANRARVLRVIGIVTLAGALVGGGIGLANELVKATDQQARHVQTVNDNAEYEQYIDHSIELPILPNLKK